MPERGRGPCATRPSLTRVFPFGPRNSPTDHFLDTISVDRRSEEREKTSQERVTKIISFYATSESRNVRPFPGNGAKRRPFPGTPAKTFLRPFPHANSFFVAFCGRA